MQYVLAILAFGALIAVHEFGHLLAARVFRIRVDRFSIGFGPAIVSFRMRQIEWVLAAVPIGGYVRVHGMNPHEEGDVKDDPSSFASRRWWQRELVLAAGSVGNWMLAWGLLVVLFVSGTHVPVPLAIGTVEPGSEAARAQLRPGDVIAGVDGRPIEDLDDLVEIVIDNPGRRIRLDVRRGEAAVPVDVVPRADQRGVGRIGVTQQYVYREYPFRDAVPLAVRASLELLGDDLRLLWRLARGRPGVELASPILIVKQVSDAATLGLDAFLRVLVHLSLALAVFNLLPFPALDGGRMLFIAIERATGRPVNPRLETALHGSGFVLLLMLIALAAFSDVRKLWSRARQSPSAAAPASGTPTPPASGAPGSSVPGNFGPPELPAGDPSTDADAESEPEP
jgi:regulator of sigma E protease